jgi:hypothetical protein
VNSVLLLAVVLITNMALTNDAKTQEQFPALVLFSAAALLLLLLAHAADERSSWLRHRIWRGRDFQAPHIQGGFAFASVAVAGALILTTVASSAPLGDFKNLNLRDNFGWLERYLPNGGNSRVTQYSDFGSTSPVASSFKADNTLVFTVRVLSGSVAFHWRMVSYDTFQTNGWALGPNSREDQVLAGSTIDAGTQDLVGPTTPGRTQVSIAVHIQDPSITHLVVANEPDTVNVGVKRTLVSSSPSSANVAWLTSDATDYTVSAYVPNTDPAGAGLTEWRLRQAGTNYPAGLVGTYTQGAGQVGTDGRKLLTEIEAWAKTQGNTFNTEYDVAKAVQTYLHSDRFTYNTDIASQMQQRCQGLSTVDCFATIRQGFCEQYATTMTMLMRVKGYPARYVLGYLPGAIDPNSLVQQVTNQQKHAWVEVFFPTYGWIPFDPTGGPGQPTVLVPGTAAGSSPSSAASPFAGTSPNPRRSRGPSDLEGPGTTSSDSGAAMVLLPLLLLAVVALALFVLWRRRMRRLNEPDKVYRNIVRLASRIGYKPAPTQTVYEYTGMLADVVPRARESLGVVAMAAVEVKYGRHVLRAERLAALASAQKMVRRALFRLVWRLPKIGGRSRSKTAGLGKRAKRGSRR